MKIIVKIEREKKEFIDTSCFHCGKSLKIHERNIRAVNFCDGCK